MYHKFYFKVLHINKGCTFMKKNRKLISVLVPEKNMGIR